MASSQSGETLIEALVVVAIMALVAMIGFPQVSHVFLTLAQRQTAVALAAELRSARAAAIEHGAPVVFEIGGDGRSYGVAGGWSATTPAGVTLATGSAPRIAFFSDGSSTGGTVWVRAARRAIELDVTRLGGDVAMAAS